MKADQKVIVVIALLPFLVGVAAAYLLPRFINTQRPFITDAAIVRFTQPQANPTDATREYHLWLRLEMPPSAFDRVFVNERNSSSADAPATKKDQLVGGRLDSETMFQDMLFIKGYVNEGAITNTGLPLKINKLITLAKKNIRSLDDEQSLANPQAVPGQRFQPLTDIYQTFAGDRIRLYIHLESGIKAQKTSDTLSLTLTYLKDNQAVQSNTLPLFSY
ncbi:MAG: hypothetical protein HZA49_02415 [Planctomycetes bacterium]|nr:hypothetical protein [Planctomycetota bacterium]